MDHLNVTQALTKTTGLPPAQFAICDHTGFLCRLIIAVVLRIVLKCSAFSLGFYVVTSFFGIHIFTLTK